MSSRKEKLRKKLEGKVKLEFLHAGAKCPACGYVFTRGFSTYTGHDGPSVMQDGVSTLTPCTRCRRLLVVHTETGAISLLDETRRMLMTDRDIAAMKLMEELLDCYTEDWS